jgi:hypothetical protein
MPPTADAPEFSFLIEFTRGQGDPRRVFDAASLLIEGLEKLDATMALAIDGQLTTALVLEDIRLGSLRVILRNLLGGLDDQALKDGEYKKAIGPLLVRAKELAIKALDEKREHAPKAISNLRASLNGLVAEADIKHIPAYAPIHEGRSWRRGRSRETACGGSASFRLRQWIRRRRRFGWTRSDKDSPDLAGSKVVTCKSMCVIPRGGSGALRPSPRSWWRCGPT